MAGGNGTGTVKEPTGSWLLLSRTLIGETGPALPRCLLPSPTSACQQLVPLTQAATLAKGPAGVRTLSLVSHCLVTA